MKKIYYFLELTSVNLLRMSQQISRIHLPFIYVLLVFQHFTFFLAFYVVLQPLFSAIDFPIEHVVSELEPCKGENTSSILKIDIFRERELQFFESNMWRRLFRVCLVQWGEQILIEGRRQSGASGLSFLQTWVVSGSPRFGNRLVMSKRFVVKHLHSTCKLRLKLLSLSHIAC